jgi:hypothetical protein
LRNSRNSNTIWAERRTELVEVALSSLDSDAQILVWYWGGSSGDLLGTFSERSYWVIRGDDTAEEFVVRLQDSPANWSMEWP